MVIVDVEGGYRQLKMLLEIEQMQTKDEKQMRTKRQARVVKV